MKLWEAMQLVEQGETVVHEALFCDITTVEQLVQMAHCNKLYDGWEVADTRKEVPPEVKSMYNALTVFDQWDCTGMSCKNCPYNYKVDGITLCDKLHECYRILRDMNEIYKLDE